MTPRPMPFNSPFCMEDVISAGYSRAEIQTWLVTREAIRHSRGVYLPASYPQPSVELSTAMFGGSRIAPLVFAAKVHALWTPFGLNSHSTCPLRRDRFEDGELCRLGSLALTTQVVTVLGLARGQSIPEVLIPLESALRNGISRSTLERAAIKSQVSKKVVTALSIADGQVESALEAYARGTFFEMKLPMPIPQFQLAIGRWQYRADFAWPQRRLIVEVDGELKYREASAIRAERERQRNLEGAGWRVIRLTWAELRQPESPIFHQLRSLLF